MNKLVKFFNGEYYAGKRIKEEYLIMGVAVVHFVYLIMFLIFNYWIMAIFNVFSVLSYVVCFIPKLRRNTLYLTIQMTAEVLLHMVFAVICIGWNYGFELYFVMLVPALYFMKYSAAVTRQKSINAWVGALFCATVFTVLKISAYDATPIYEVASHEALIMGLFNGLMSFGLILFLMSIFFGAIVISERGLREKNEKLKNIANIDPLTELFNRRGLTQFVKKTMDDAVNNETPFCIIICDIDDFKAINDTYGHSCGDYVLQRIAETIKEHTRHNDCICRWGGEEILILLTSCEYDMALRVAEKLRVKMENLVMNYNSEEIRFTMTFGIAEYSKELSFDELVDRADEKLYEGKRAGKNIVM